MADFDGIIDPVAEWGDIPQLSNEAIALGGEGGAMNAQALALTKRIVYLLSAAGAGKIGAAGSTYRTVQQQLDILLRGSISINDPKYAGGADPSKTAAQNFAAIQAAITDAANGGGYQTVDGALVGGYVSLAPAVHGKPGVYEINDQLECPPYFRMALDGIVIHQTDPTKIILNGPSAYQWDVWGGHLVGGLHNVLLQNDNLNTTRWNFHGTTFALSRSYAIKTFPTDGDTSHLSANLTVRSGAFYRCNNVLLNFCDSAVIEDCWVNLDRSNFTPDSAAFVNGSLTTDGYPNLYLHNMFGVPSMGTGGSRLLKVRWIDQMAGGVFVGQHSRFGGEDAGMPVVYFFALPHTTSPFSGPVTSIKDSEISVGPTAQDDSAVVVLKGQVPKRCSIINNKGPHSKPYVIDYANGVGDFAAYTAAWSAAAINKPAFRYFQLEIFGNDAYDTIGTGGIYGKPIPDGYRPYLNNLRMTKLGISAPQAIPVSFGELRVTFAAPTPENDTQGGWAAANPKRLIIPVGATRMRITVYAKILTAAAGYVAVRLVNQSGTIICEHDLGATANPDGPGHTFSFPVDTSMGTYFEVCIRCNNAAETSLTKCTVITEALDFLM